MGQSSFIFTTGDSSSTRLDARTITISSKSGYRTYTEVCDMSIKGTTYVTVIVTPNLAIMVTPQQLEDFMDLWVAQNVSAQSYLVGTEDTYAKEFRIYLVEQVLDLVVSHKSFMRWYKWQIGVSYERFEY